MRTDEGKRAAESRHQTMLIFLEAIANETSGLNGNYA